MEQFKQDATGGEEEAHLWTLLILDVGLSSILLRLAIQGKKLAEERCDTAKLKYVLSVAEYQNFTVAAEHSFVTQPTLSMQIQKLEDALNVQIFNRSKKPIELTEIGKKIVEQAKIIVNESNRISDIVDQQKGFIGGEFKLGIIPTVMPTLLPMFLNNFTKKYPKVKLIIEELTTDEIIRKLTDGHIDAGLAATPLENESIIEKPLYYEPFVGLIPKKSSSIQPKKHNH